MNRRVVTRPQAFRDMAELADYIAQDSLVSAHRFAEAFDSACEDMRISPSLGSAWEADNEKYADLRFWPIQGFPNHRIFFRTISGGIEILRVCHA
jgi:plasmid stabilization system protein ParE